MSVTIAMKPCGSVVISIINDVFCCWYEEGGSMVDHSLNGSNKIIKVNSLVMSVEERLRKRGSKLNSQLRKLKDRPRQKFKEKVSTVTIFQNEVVNLQNG